MKHSLLFLASILSLSATPATAQLTLTISGSSSSNIATFTAEGSTVFSGSSGYSTPEIRTLLPTDSALLMDVGIRAFSSGSLLMSNNTEGTSRVLDGVSLRKDAIGQGLDYISPINVSFTSLLFWPGQSLSWSGTAELDLAASGTTWSNFVPGTHVALPNFFAFESAEPVTVIIKEIVEFEDLCNGDGGNQLGCTSCPCSNNAATGTIGGCLNSAGNSARLEASGSNSVSLPPGSSDDLRFSMSGAPSSSFAILNSGDSVAPLNAMNPCFGQDSGTQSAQYDGLRCAVQNTRRHGGRVADAVGTVGISNNPWGGEAGPNAGIAVAAGFSAGQTRYFQAIYRELTTASCGRGLNTSQAVGVTFAP